MSEYVTIAVTSELPNSGDRMVVEIDDHYIAIFNVDQKFYAIEDLCTHDDGPLAEGELHGTIIECPRHGATFDVTTGAVLSMPAIRPVPRYDVRVDADQIQILL